MKKYLLAKTSFRSCIDLLDLSKNGYLSLFSLGYNLGDFLQNTVGINIQYNPYSGDFSTPIEDTLIQADELGFEIY